MTAACAKLIEFRRPGLAGRLRLESALSLLKLGTQEAYHKLFMEYFEHFAWTLQDPAFQVRSGLVHKFIRYASQGRINNSKMNTALFLTAHDPDVENRLMPQKFIAERVKIAKPGEYSPYPFSILKSEYTS